MQSLMSNPREILAHIGRHIAKSMRPAPFLFIQDGEDYYCLRVSGNSMTRENIHDDDLVLVRRTHEAKNGDIIVAVVDGEAMLKKYKKIGHQIELHSADSVGLPIPISEENDFRIAGVFVGHFNE